MSGRGGIIMPVTKALEKVRKFESAGFALEQFDGQQGLTEFINEKTDKLELRIKASHRDLLMKIFAVVAGCTGIAVVVSK